MANDTITEGSQTDIAKNNTECLKKNCWRAKRASSLFLYFSRISKVGKCSAFDFGPLKSRENEWILVKPNFT